jgi:exodeoxyribonuclease V beta subunit
VTEIDLDRHAVVEASAGTGKTYTLEKLVQRLLVERGVRLEQILLVTYTEKATGELKGRLRQMLEKQLSENTRHRQIFQSAIDTFDQANIHTIHGFCQRVLLEYAFENREAFRLELVNDADLMPGCLREIQRTAWRREYGDRLPLILELAGYAKVRGGPEEWERRVQTLAGSYRPGCGHQLLPEMRDNWLESLQQLDASLRTVVPELRARAGEPLRLDRIEQHPWNTGFAQLKFAPVRRQGRRARLLLPLLRWLADSKTQQQPAAAFRRLLHHCADVPHFDKYGFTWLTDRLPSSAREELHSRCPELAYVVIEVEKLRRASDDLVLSDQLVVRTVRQLQDSLASLKRERGLHSFEDLLTRVDRALDPRENPRADILVAALRNRYAYAIVDEFQDTDPIQWRIFRKIFVESAPGHRLFVVGDPKQAIFGFRGADLHTFLVARDDLIQRHGAVDHVLPVNWRSSPELLEALNCLFERGRWFDGTGIDYTLVQAPEESERFNAVVRDRSERAALTLVDLTRYSWLGKARRQQARFIVQEIQRLLGGKDGQPALEFSIKGARQALHLGHLCILVKARHEAGPVVDELRTAGIPFSFYKQPGLWQSEEAVHLGYVLRALARPDHPQAFRKALLTRFYRIPPEKLASIDDWRPSHAVNELFGRWRELAEERRWAELFQSLLEDTGVLVNNLGSGEAERASANYRHMVQTLEQTAYGRDLDLFDLLEHLEDLRRRPGDDETAMQPIETDRPRVRSSSWQAGSLRASRRPG